MEGSERIRHRAVRGSRDGGDEEGDRLGLYLYHHGRGDGDPRAAQGRHDILLPDGMRAAPAPEGRGEEVGLPHRGEVGHRDGRSGR